MHVLITGGAGFLGSHLAEHLCPESQVRILDNLSRDAISQTGLLEHPNVSFVRGDVTKREDLEKAMLGITHVIHLASLAGVDTVASNPILTMRTVLLGTMNVLELFRWSDVQRVINVSTSEVYGPYANDALEGEYTRMEPVGEARWTYAVSKLAVEHLAAQYYSNCDMDVVSVRPFNIFGPRQVGGSAVKAFIQDALQHKPLTIHNDGDQVRAWCYVSDFVRAVDTLLWHPNAPGNVFNVGNPLNACTILELATLINQIAGNEGMEHVSTDAPQVNQRVPSVEKIKQAVGWSPSVGLEEGLQKTVEFYRSFATLVQ